MAESTISDEQLAILLRTAKPNENGSWAHELSYWDDLTIPLDFLPGAIFDLLPGVKAGPRFPSGVLACGGAVEAGWKPPYQGDYVACFGSQAAAENALCVAVARYQEIRDAPVDDDLPWAVVHNEVYQRFEVHSANGSLMAQFQYGIEMNAAQAERVARMVAAGSVAGPLYAALKESAPFVQYYKEESPGPLGCIWCGFSTNKCELDEAIEQNAAVLAAAASFCEPNTTPSRS